MIKKRIEQLQAKLSNDEAFLVVSDINRLYLTGFKSSAGAVLLTKNTADTFLDFRYFEKAKKEIKDLNIILTKKLYSQIKEILLSTAVKTVYIETDYVNLESFFLIKSALSDFEVSEDSTFSNLIKKMRFIKTDEEIALIKEAQKITDKAFLHILNFISDKKTEKEIALELEFFMRRLSSEGVSFDTIAVSGKNSSLPHGVPTDKRVDIGDFVTMDFGAVIKGYRSDMTRTVAVGRINEKQRFVYDTVLKAQLKALEKIKPNTVCKDIDKVARDFISDAGFGENFGHGLGHSVGLEIHESPAFNTKDETPLEKGMVLTVEPGIYIENEFGVRIEDMVVITDKDYVNLTESDKNLIIL